MASVADAPGGTDADVVLIGCGTQDADDAVTYLASLRRSSSAAVLVTSAYPRRDVMADPRWRDLGFVEWVTKPVKPDALAGAVVRGLGIEDAPTFGHDPKDEVVGETRARPLAILLAEDNALNQRLAVTLLTRMGHSVTVANDGREAVEQAVTGLFDLILMDVQMPEVDGLEATRRIIAEMGDARPRIVALTANALSEDRVSTAAAGMDGYLAKPLRRDELAAALAETADLLAEAAPKTVVALPATPTTPPAAGEVVSAAAFRQRVADMVGSVDPDFERELVDAFLDGLPGIVAAESSQGRTPATPSSCAGRRTR